MTKGDFFFIPENFTEVIVLIIYVLELMPIHKGLPRVLREQLKVSYHERAALTTAAKYVNKNSSPI